MDQSAVRHRRPGHVTIADHLVVAGVGAPAVVVVHDGGLTPRIRAVCDDLADAGLTALALGSEASDEELAAGVRDLRRAGVMAPRISALGVGSGAALVLRAAARGLFDAVVAFDTAALPVDAPLPCPVQLHPGTHEEAGAAWRRAVEFLGGRPAGGT